MKNTPEDILALIKQNHDQQMSKRKAMVRGFLNGNPPYTKQVIEHSKNNPRVQAINRRWQIARDHDEAMQKIIQPLFSRQ